MRDLKQEMGEKFDEHIFTRAFKLSCEIGNMQAENTLLKRELALLRKVADAAREFISSTGCNSKECKKCDPKYIGFCMWSGIGQALAELDKEGER